MQRGAYISLNPETKGHGEQVRSRYIVKSKAQEGHETERGEKKTKTEARV